MHGQYAHEKCVRRTLKYCFAQDSIMSRARLQPALRFEGLFVLQEQFVLIRGTQKAVSYNGDENLFSIFNILET